METILNINPIHIGSSFDDFLKDEGILEEVNIIVDKRILDLKTKLGDTYNSETTKHEPEISDRVDAI